MNPKLRRLALIWHRRLGLAAAPFVLLLVVTGVLLNHTDSLGLDRRAATADWLLRWYGVERGAPPVGFAAGDSWVSWQAGRLYFDGAVAAENAAPLVGAVRRGPALAAATTDAVYLFAATGELVEKAAPVGVPRPIEAIGPGPGDAIVLFAAGRAWAGGPDLVEWRETAPAGVSRALPETPPRRILDAIAEDRRGAGLPWERVLLDLHSGRLFGRLGPLIMDAAAAALALAALVGVYNWWRARP